MWGKYCNLREIARISAFRAKLIVYSFSIQPILLVYRNPIRAFVLSAAYWLLLPSKKYMYIDHRPSATALVHVHICMHWTFSVIRSPCPVLLRPLVDQIDSVWRGKCHRVQSEHTLLESEDVLFTVVVPGPRGPVWQQRPTVLLLTFILSLQGSLYETSNLDRGGNRKKKIEEFSRSSREKLVQSKNKMFSKFTSILQHAVEAVSFCVHKADLYVALFVPPVCFAWKRPLVA